MKNKSFIVRMILGSVFACASLSKIASPFRFATVVQSYELIPEKMVSLLAIAIPWVELICGAVLLIAVLQRASSWILCGLSITFALAISQALLRGLDLDCGCFAGPTKIGWGHVVFDLFLAAIAAWLALQTVGSQKPVASKGSETNVYRALVAMQLLALAMLFNASSVTLVFGAGGDRLRTALLFAQATTVLIACWLLFRRPGFATTLRTTFFALLIPLSLGFAANASNPLPHNEFQTALNSVATLQKQSMDRRIESAMMDLSFLYHPHLFANDIDFAPLMATNEVNQDGVTILTAKPGTFERKKAVDAEPLAACLSTIDYFEYVDCRIVGVEPLPSDDVVQTTCLIEGASIEKDGRSGHLRLQIEIGFNLGDRNIASWKPIEMRKTIGGEKWLPRSTGCGWEVAVNLNPAVKQIQLPPQENARLLVFHLPRIGEFPEPLFTLPDGVRLYSKNPKEVANPIPSDIPLLELESVFQASASHRSTGGALICDTRGRVIWMGNAPPSLSRLKQLLTQNP